MDKGTLHIHITTKHQIFWKKNSILDQDDSRIWSQRHQYGKSSSRVQSVQQSMPHSETRLAESHWCFKLVIQIKTP